MSRLLLFLPLLVLVGCSPQTTDEDLSQWREYRIVEQIKEKNVLAAEEELTKIAVNEVEDVKDSVESAPSLKPSYVNSIPEIRDKSREYVAIDKELVLNQLERASLALNELEKLIAAVIEVKGRSQATPALDSESLKIIREEYVDSAEKVKKAERPLVEGRLGPETPGFFAKLWGWMKFIILGALVLASIIGFGYVRITYGKALTTVYVIVASTIVSAFALIAYTEVIVVLAVVLFIIGFLIVAFFLFRKTDFAETVISGVQEVRDKLTDPEKERIDSILERKFDEKTKAEIEKIKRRNKLPSSKDLE
jgi:hypothetical protein